VSEDVLPVTSVRSGSRRAAVLIGLALSMVLSACSTLQAARGGPGQKLDPWESWNRKVFDFNDKLDVNVLKPVATAYSNVVPQPVRRSVDNFFGNFGDAWSAINNTLQGKFENAGHDVVRFGTNSIFGIFGFMDVASEMGLDHQYEDFGQTLGRWGVGAGAYIVWPLIGPSTVRESFAMPLDLSASPALVINDGAGKFGIATLQIVNKRANLLGASQVLDDIALDRYTFVRDAYLQRRRSLVFDGDDASSRHDDDEDAPATAGLAAPAASAVKP
jgi:phospholipid-binding lipoprotein MlaA